MSNSEKILKSLSSLIENGILTSKDIKEEISTDLKFKKDKIINKLELISREEFEVFYNSLKTINFPFEIIKKYTLFETNRWDLETMNKKIIKLPPENYIRSLENYLNLRNFI